jgi:nucleoside-diphosphate-sugar epimerase
MKQRVVITGAAGFIGSHLAEALLDRDYAVIGIDNLLTGDTANITHLANRDFTFIKHDVTNYIYIEGPVDYVLHWASPASPIDYLELPIPTLKVGALGTHKALGLAKAKNARFVLASTSERQSSRAAGRLRRSQALRRGDDDGVPQVPRRGYEDRPHLQHLRASHARE